jgi:hypothetical protein
MGEDFIWPITGLIADWQLADATDLSIGACSVNHNLRKFSAVLCLRRFMVIQYILTCVL